MLWTTAVALIGAAPGLGAAWRVAHVHLQHGASVNAVSCSAAATCTFVGTARAGGGFALRERSGARHVSLHATDADASVSCRGAWCEAVGGGPRSSPRIERFSGGHWRRQTVHAPPAPYFTDLTDVSCASGSRCIAVGSAPVVTNVQCSPSSQFSVCLTSAPRLQRLRRGVWDAESIPEPQPITPAIAPPGLGPYESLDAVSCAAADACMVVGHWGLGSAPGDNHMSSDYWNGTRWALGAIPEPAGARYGSPEAVSCPGARSCVAVGIYGATAARDHLWAVHWDGRRWHLDRGVAPKLFTSWWFDSVSCATSRSCIAVGGETTRHGLTRPLAEFWNGARWSLQLLASPPRIRSRGGAALTGVSCVADGECVTVGNYIGKSEPGWFTERDF